MITQDTIIQYNPQWRNTVLQEIYLDVDTSIPHAPITITLPEIASMGGFYNVKFYITDVGGGASYFPIYVATQGNDLIDSTNIITAISADHGSCMIACTGKNNWICFESSSSTAATTPIVLLANSTIDFGLNEPQEILSNYAKCVITDVVIKNASSAVSLTQQGSLSDVNTNLVAKIIFNNAGEKGLITSENFLNKDVNFTAGKAVSLYGLVQQNISIFPFYFQSLGLDSGVTAEINIYGYNL